MAPSAAPAQAAGHALSRDQGPPLIAEGLICKAVTSESPLPTDERIDLVATYLADDGTRVVLAVENKIHAGESHDQLASYARELLRQYGYERTAICLVFLTPAGRPPTTLDDETAGDSRLHIRVASWARIAKLLWQNPPEEESAEHQLFTQTVARHIDEDLMGETLDRSDARALFEDPECARTLLRICKEQPQLGDMREAWVTRVSAWLSNKERPWGQVATTIYPSSHGREIREIKVQVHAWDAAGIPLCIMVHNDTPHRGPAVRLLVYAPHYERNAAGLQRLAELSEGVIDGSYARAWPGCPWSRVLASDRETSNPKSRQVDHYAYNKETIEQCLAALDKQFGEIETAVHRYLKESAPQ